MTGLHHVTVLLILYVFDTRVTADKQAQCEPQNMLLELNQELKVSWEVHSSCTSRSDQLIFELLLFVDNNQTPRESATVIAHHKGNSHQWRWVSSLPLECASHSVQIRSRYKNQTSRWITKTLPGKEHLEKPWVYPQDAVFKVGSRVTFCCFIPLGQMFSTMLVSNYIKVPSNVSMINNHTYSLTVDLLWKTNKSGLDVKCKTADVNMYGGSTASVGYLPTDGNLTCETRDFQSVQCFWTIGSNTFETTEYRLLEQSCSGQSKGQCSQKFKVDYGKRNWTLTAVNVLGKTELVDEADLTKRVYMYAPENLTHVAGARKASLRWTWAVPQYKELNMTCKINITDRNTSILKNGTGLQSVVLSDLIPYWKYTVKIQCASNTDFWKWGEWSKPITIYTKGDVPDVLDIWMHKANHQTEILWKLLANNQSHGQIRDYEVTWVDSYNTENKITVVHPHHSVALNLSANQKYIVKVTARNINGSSKPSQIIIPSESKDISPSRINGTGGGFSLSWDAIATANCGYIVDWCPVSKECSVDWLKVPPDSTNATITSQNFEDGVRYMFSVYVCTDDTPILHRKREGYMKELKIADSITTLKCQQHASSVKVSWDQIDLRNQTAFINGYVLKYKHENRDLNVTTGDPLATSLTVKNLHMTSYKFTLSALTSEGECGFTTTSFTLVDHFFYAAIISLATVFTLFLLIAVFCHWRWKCIKQKIYPPIPEPVLIGKWLPSQDLLTYRPKEELTMSVPKLHNILTTSSDGYICQKLIIPTQPPQSAKLNIVSNPAYELAMQENTAQFDLETEHQDCKEENSSDYQPQLIEALFRNQTDSDSGMSCASAYIEVPHSPFN